MAYSEDLRLKVIRARLELNVSIKETAKTFGIGLDTVKRWTREYKQEGKTKATTETMGLKPLIRGENKELFLSLLEEFPDATLVELSAMLWERAGIEIGESGLSRTCTRLGITRKKTAPRK